LILLGVPPLGVVNRNTVGDGDFQPIRDNIAKTVTTTLASNSQ